MERRIVAVDVDEVLFPFLPVMNEWINSVRGTFFKLEDYKKYIFEGVWGGTPEDTASLIKEFIKTDIYRKVKPLISSLEGIEILSKENDLIAVSYRPKQIQQ